MKKINLVVLLILFSSCSSQISKVEKLAIDFFKGETLDPEKFEIIMIETLVVTERNLKVNELRESIQEVQKGVKNWRGLEEFKRDPENGNIYGVRNYAVLFGDPFDDTRKRIDRYQSEYEKQPRSSYTSKLREQLLSEIGFMQGLFCTEPESGQKKIEEYEGKISSLNRESEQSPISRYDVKLRFYAMNRLGTRGITDASIEIYPNEEGNLVLGMPEYR